MNAIISECGQYRYRLDREVQDNGGPVFLYSGINPSTANETKDDQTTKKWIGFTKIFGGSKYIAINPFGYRSKNVKDLASVFDPVGPEWLEHTFQAISEADILVPCWGNTTKAPKLVRGQFDQLLRMMVDSGKPIKCFGFTASGDPLHPMMLGYNTVLQDFKSLRDK